MRRPDDIEDARGGFRQLYWNTDEGRARFPLRVLLALGIFLLALLVVGVGIELVDWLVGFPADGAFETLVLVASFTLVVFVLLRAVDRRYRRDVGLGFGSRWWSDLAVGLALGACMAGAAVLPALLVGFASVDGTVVTREADLFAGLGFPVGLVVGCVFFALLGFFEELLFRGYLLVNTAEGTRSWLGDRDAVLAGVAVSAVLFGLGHAINPAASLLSTVSIVLFGGVLGASYASTDRLAIPVGIHIAWNATLGLVFGVPVSGLTTGVSLVAVEFDGPTLVIGGGFGPEGGLAALAALVVGVGGLVGWLRFRGELTIVTDIAVPDLRTEE